MTDTDRYYYTFDHRSGSPVGIGDSLLSGGPAARPRAPMLSARQRAALLVLALAFACGFYAAVLLLDCGGHQDPTIVVCPEPGTGQVAVVPAECGAPQGVNR